MNESRRRVLQKMVQALGAMIAAFSAPTLFSSCGKSDSTSGTTPVSGGNCSANGTSSSIASNHGHTITVTTADITAAADKTYDISGSAGHAHSVTITAAQFATLASNQGVQITSTVNGHSHVVTVNCA